MSRTPAESEARVLTKLRAICLALPDAHETSTWGHPNFRAGKKIFAAFHRSAGVPCIWCRVDDAQHEVLARDPRCLASRHGGARWIAVRADRRVDWKLVRALMAEAYRLVAPKALVAKLDAPAATKQKSAARSRGRRSPMQRAKSAS
jgi:predicted DNA-binding protein (MmcQ/YjbR family)